MPTTLRLLTLLPALLLLFSALEGVVAPAPVVLGGQVTCTYGSRRRRTVSPSWTSATATHD